MVLSSARWQEKIAGEPGLPPLEASEWFAGQRSARPLVAGTVARGQLQTDLALFTGRKTRLTRSPAEQEPAPQPGRDRAAFDENRDFVDTFPIAVDERLVRHGRDRYSIYCIVCH